MVSPVTVPATSLHPVPQTLIMATETQVITQITPCLHVAQVLVIVGTYKGIGGGKGTCIFTKTDKLVHCFREIQLQ